LPYTVLCQTDISDHPGEKQTILELQKIKIKKIPESVQSKYKGTQFKGTVPPV
jgi:hypothetical protein